jgi:hypothetical protein
MRRKKPEPAAKQSTETLVGQITRKMDHLTHPPRLTAAPPTSMPGSRSKPTRWLIKSPTSTPPGPSRRPPPAICTPPPHINAQAAALAAAAKLRAADDERRQAKRNTLADKLTVEAKALADLKIEKAAVEGERRTVEADLGPVRYLAALIGADNEAVLRWFILVVALLLDPDAVLLLLAATRTRS